jgi:hypothetical protein
VSAAVNMLGQRQSAPDPELSERLAELELAATRLLKRHREVRPELGMANPHLSSQVERLENEVHHLAAHGERRISDWFSVER